jgi:hypothetical protein
MVRLNGNMTWIIISIPLMLVAIAIAVLPVLLTTIWESRTQLGSAGLAAGTTPGYNRAAPLRLESVAATKSHEDWPNGPTEQDLVPEALADELPFYQEGVVVASNI